MIKNAIAILGFIWAAMCLGGTADAQQAAKVVASCGAPTYTAGTTNYVTVDTHGNTCGANGAAGSTAVTGNVGGYSFQLAPTITVQNAPYSIGNSVGGLITVTGAARVNGGTGTLTNIRVRSAGGLTPTLWVYAWSKTPASTCTDKAAFVSSSTDAPYALPGFPQAMTLSVAGSWDASTYGQITQQTVQFKNQDASPGTAIYECIVTGTAITPATTGDISLVETGIQD